MDKDPAIAAVTRFVEIDAEEHRQWKVDNESDALREAACQALVEACTVQATTLAGLAAQIQLAASMVGQLGPECDLSNDDTFATGHWTWRDDLDGVILRNLVETAKKLAEASS